MIECPVCEKGKLKKGKVKETMFGVYLGEFPADICNSCGESFMDSEAMKQIEQIAKKKGIWGLGKKTSVARTGNSLAVRIPKKIAEFLKLKDGTEVYVHPDKKRLIVDL